MAYEVQLNPGEELIDEVAFQINDKAEPFAFAVSNQAIYLPGKKFIAVSDPYYFRRVPHAEVKQVSIRSIRPYAVWGLALIMFLFGLITTILIFLPFFIGMEGTHKVSGWPIAILVGGLIIPFAARGRLGLSVLLAKGKFQWTPPLVIDRASKKQIEILLVRIAAACEKAGLTIVDERKR